MATAGTGTVGTADAGGVAWDRPAALICVMPDVLSAASPVRPPRWSRWLVISAAAIVVAHLLDGVAWRMLRLPTVYDKDWGRLLRTAGFLPTWWLVALVYGRHVQEPAARRRGTWLLALAPTLGGVAAEVLKLLVRRLRPDPEQFGYAFRSFADGPLSNRGMGMPSSHALVAFAAAFALARLFPRARWVFFALAAGCALTRVMATAHFLSDTVVAACVGWGIATLLWQRLARGAQ